MSDLVTLDEAKAYIRVMHNHEDGIISLMVAAASKAVIAVADAWDGTGEVPAQLKMAVLARVGILFDERYSVRGAEGEDRFVSPFRVIGI